MTDSAVTSTSEKLVPSSDATCANGTSSAEGNVNQQNGHDSDLAKKIIRQIEYYFSDFNMVRDKFLKNEITKDDGWIPLSVLITFKRLQSLTTDFKTIIDALKTSSSGLLEINETDNKLRRQPGRPLPESQAELELLLRNRTVYVKGFPKTADITIDKLLVFFEKFGSIESIQLKRQFKSKEFDGAAFVVFPSDEKAREFIEKSKETPLTFEENSTLECSLQDDFYKKKAMESANGGKSMDADTKEKRANEKQARKDKRKEDLEKKTNEHLEKLSTENLPGALIHLCGLTPNVTRELIKAKFNPFTERPWVDFNRGDAEAWVRLNEANSAKTVLEKVLATGQGKLVIDDKEVISRVVEGEEEAQFWKEANEKRAAERIKKSEGFAGRRGARNKRNRRSGQKRKRNQGQNDDNDSNDEEGEEESNDATSPKKVKAGSDD